MATADYTLAKNVGLLLTMASLANTKMDLIVVTTIVKNLITNSNWVEKKNSLGSSFFASA